MYRDVTVDFGERQGLNGLFLSFPISSDEGAVFIFFFFGYSKFLAILSIAYNL